jgi:hypothetical protein
MGKRPVAGRGAGRSCSRGSWPVRDHGSWAEHYRERSGRGTAGAFVVAARC